MLVTLAGMVTEPFAVGYATKIVLSLLYNTPFSELYEVFAVSTVISVRPVQPEKACPVMLVTPFPMVMLVRPVQPKNPHPMLVPPVIMTVFSVAGIKEF